MKNQLYKLASVLLVALALSGCNYLDITPVGQVIPGKTSEYRALLNSGYKLMPQHKAYLSMRTNEYNPEDDPWGMGLDGFDVYKDIYMWNDQNSDNPKTQEYPYISFYQVIFTTNEIINNGAKATQDTEETMNQVTGEAYALRAYAYFELVNMYAPVYDKETASSTKAVPIVMEMDVEKTYPRATLQEVYDLILGDLQKAESLMTVPQQEGMNKYRFSQESLHALKSRVFLYMKDWNQAIAEAQKALAINSSLEDMNSDAYQPSTHYKSKEAMLALEHLTTLELRDYASVSSDLQALYKEGDLRPNHYFTQNPETGYFITKKLTTIDERVSFRRAELFLNAAEALARTGKDAEARKQLGDLLKNRYTPAAYTLVMQNLNSLSGEKLVNEILVERQRELALEGHQWYDWRRTTQPEITKTVKGVQCTLKKNDPRYTLQFPRSAREANPLLTQ